MRSLEDRCSKSGGQRDRHRRSPANGRTDQANPLLYQIYRRPVKLIAFVQMTSQIEHPPLGSRWLVSAALVPITVKRYPLPQTSNIIVVSIPLNKTRHTLCDGRTRLKTQFPLDFAYVCKGVAHVAWLHRQHQAFG